jgi:hypothetical protein
MEARAAATGGATPGREFTDAHATPELLTMTVGAATVRRRRGARWIRMICSSLCRFFTRFSLTNS